MRGAPCGGNRLITAVLVGGALAIGTTAAAAARTTRVLPIASHQTADLVAATPYASARHLAEAVVREYLYSTLFELLLDALAAEHGTRLVATQGAAEWLETRVKTLQRQLASARRESSTQEVLDIAGGALRRRRTVSTRRP